MNPLETDHYSVDDEVSKDLMHLYKDVSQYDDFADYSSVENIDNEDDEINTQILLSTLEADKKHTFPCGKVPGGCWYWRRKQCAINAHGGNRGHGTILFLSLHCLWYRKLGFGIDVWIHPVVQNRRDQICGLISNVILWVNHHIHSSIHITRGT